MFRYVLTAMLSMYTINALSAEKSESDKDKENAFLLTKGKKQTQDTRLARRKTTVTTVDKAAHALYSALTGINFDGSQSLKKGKQ